MAEFDELSDRLRYIEGLVGKAREVVDLYQRARTNSTFMSDTEYLRQEAEFLVEVLIDLQKQAKTLMEEYL